MSIASSANGAKKRSSASTRSSTAANSKPSRKGQQGRKSKSAKRQSLPEFEEEPEEEEEPGEEEEPEEEFDIEERLASARGNGNQKKRRVATQERAPGTYGCAQDGIRDALREYLAPGQVTELRALNAIVDGSNRPGTYYGYFAVERIDALVDAVRRIESSSGIYFVPNPINPALLARAPNMARIARDREPTTADKDIGRRHWLLIDVDPARPAGISSTDDEKGAAWDIVKSIVDYLSARVSCRHRGRLGQWISLLRADRPARQRLRRDGGAAETLGWTLRYSGRARRHNNV